jgi:hypothetical protein
MHDAIIYSMSEPPEPFIYQLKVLLLGIIPMIWRRLLVYSTTTIADLHHILQITMGWSDDHLHMFRIHGKQYGIARAGGLSFSDDPCTVRLDNFRFRINEIFFYEYDFIDGWRHQIRVEAILAPETQQHYPICIDGRRSCPPEDCGGPRVFMELRQQNSLGHIIMRLADIVDDGDYIEDYYHEFYDLQYWLTAERFNRKVANQRLCDYASGKEVYMWG